VSFNPRALTERTLKGFVDRWVRAQRAKPCPTPDQWPPARTACQEDIAQLLGFANWHEAITAIRQVQSGSLANTEGANEPAPPYPTAIDSTHDAVAFLTWAYEQGMDLLDFKVGAHISSKGRTLTAQALSNLQHAVFQGICLPSNDQAAPPQLLRPKLPPLQFQCQGIEDGHMTVHMSAHQPVFPPGFDSVPQPLMALLVAPPKQGLILMAGLSSVMPSMATFIAERYVRMPHGHRVSHTLPGLDLTERFGAQRCLIQYHGPETLDLKVRMAMRRRPDTIDTMVLGEPRSAKDVDQVITASLVGHLVYAAHPQGRVVDAVVDWVGKFPQEEQWSRIVDVLSALRLMVGGASVRLRDGTVQWIYEYLSMNDGLVDEMLQMIKADQESRNPSPSWKTAADNLNSLRNVLEAAMQKHGHTWNVDPQRWKFAIP